MLGYLDVVRVKLAVSCVPEASAEAKLAELLAVLLHALAVAILIVRRKNNTALRESVRKAADAERAR
jgi:hypothetical protein